MPDQTAAKTITALRRAQASFSKHDNARSGAISIRDEAIRECARRGMTVTAIASIIGLSKQRVSQIIKQGQ